MELAREFDGGFGGFGAAGREVDAATREIRWSESEKARGEFFRGHGLKLGGVSECNLGGLRGHCVGNGLHAVTDVDDSGLAGSVEIFLSVGRNDPGAFATDGDGKRFFEITGEKSGSHEMEL